MDSKETEDLFYFFKYVKKNLFLIAALDRQFAFYEDELQAQFVKLHEKVQATARKRENLYMPTMINQLTLTMAEAMRQINPPCKEEIDMRMLPEELDDIEMTSLALQSGVLSEIELQNVGKFAQRQMTAVRHHTAARFLKYMTSFQLLGNGKDGGKQVMYLAVMLMMMLLVFFAHHFFNINIFNVFRGQPGPG